MSGNEEVKLTGKIGQVDVGKKCTILRSKSTHGTSIVVDGKEIVITGGLVKTARLAEEWYQDVEDPELIVEAIKKSKVKVDIFTFWQRLPETEPKYKYYMELESIAALP